MPAQVLNHLSSNDFRSITLLKKSGSLMNNRIFFVSLFDIKCENEFCKAYVHFQLGIFLADAFPEIFKGSYQIRVLFED